MTGRLVLVVGPSGAGKDSVMKGARARLQGDESVVFPRRMITRPCEPEGEDHDSTDPASFSVMQAAGAFALAWSAHGLCYGIPASIDRDIRAGRTVVVNVSRGVIDQARRLYPGLLVVCISAERDLLRRRLLDRGREETDAVEARVERASAFAIHGPDVSNIDNGGPLANSVERFLTLLQPDSA